MVVVLSLGDAWAESQMNIELLQAAFTGLLICSNASVQQHALGTCAAAHCVMSTGREGFSSFQRSTGYGLVTAAVLCPPAGHLESAG